MPSVQPLTTNYIFTVRRYIVISVVVGLVAVLLTIFVTVPQVLGTFDTNTERIQANQKLERLQNKVRQLDLASNPEFLSQTGLVNALLPSKKPLVETLSGVNTAQVASNVRIVSIELNPGEVATASSLLTPDINVTGPSATLPLYLTIEGTLEQLNQFFAAVERTTPLITITELTLSPLEGDGILGGDPLTVTTQPYSAKIVLNAAYYLQSIETAAEDELPQVSVDQQRIVDELASFTVIAPDIQQQIVGGGLQDLFGLATPPLVIQSQVNAQPSVQQQIQQQSPPEPETPAFPQSGTQNPTPVNPSVNLDASPQP